MFNDAVNNLLHIEGNRVLLIKPCPLLLHNSIRNVLLIWSCGKLCVADSIAMTVAAAMVRMLRICRFLQKGGFSFRFFLLFLFSF